MRTLNEIACLALAYWLVFLPPGTAQSARLAADEVRAVVVDPHNHSTVYVGTAEGKVFKSTDGGGSWADASLGLPNWRIQTLAIVPSEPTTLYLGTDGYGVYKTTDGAENWTRLDSGFESLQVMSIVIDPSNPETVFAGAFDGWVFKSLDGGASWTAHGLGVVNTWVSALAIDHENTSTIYAATGGDNHHLRTYGVFKTVDGGRTWNPINSGFPVTRWIFSMAIDPSAASTVYLGTDTRSGLFKTTDGGLRWFLVQPRPNPHPSSILALAVDPTDSSTLYVGFGDSLNGRGGIAMSNDGGESWDASPSGLENGQVFALAIDPLETSTIYAGTAMGVFKSTDRGRNWLSIGPLQPER